MNNNVKLKLLFRILKCNFFFKMFVDVRTSSQREKEGKKKKERDRKMAATNLFAPFTVLT